MRTLRRPDLLRKSTPFVIAPCAVFAGAVIAGIGAVLLSSCSIGAPSIPWMSVPVEDRAGVPPSTALSDRPAPRAEGLAYRDHDQFDTAVRTAMETRAESVAILVDGQVDVNHLPPRLERWLSAVRQSGGQVRAQAMDRRGNLLVDVAVRLVDPQVDRSLVDAARAYDAVVYYRRADGSVQNVRFDRRRTLR